MLIKITKLIFSTLIIIITLKVIFNLTSNLTINIETFLKDNNFKANIKLRKISYLKLFLGRFRDKTQSLKSI